MWEKVPLLFCLVLSNVGAAKASQCWQGATYPETVVSPAVRSSSILRVPNVASLAQCVAACCDLPGCDLAWLFERRCYILRCQQRENCRPRERPGADSYLAFLRRGPPQTLVLQSLVRGEPYAGRWRPQTQSSEAPGDLEALKDLALFDEARQDFADPGMVDLEYPEGGPEEKLVGGTGGAETELFPDWPDLEREMGFNQSESEDGPEGEPTEISVAQNSASSGANISLASQHSDTEPTSAPTPTEKTDSKVQSVSLAMSDSTSVISPVEEHVPGTSQKSHMRPSLPTDATPHVSNNTAMPTEPAQPLMVSLGEPMELTLPMDTVKIEASIHPDPQTESTYSYEWHLVYSTDGHREAIEGEHNKSIRLSRLSAGQYLLTVAVSGHGSYGEGSVNITVKEVALRLSKPPKAVVFPLTQVLSLPFTEAIINASQSKADEATVSCHWDQMSGPPIDLGDSSNKWILNLSNLDFGNYTFRFTVTDATGLSDFTTATLRVIPPKASDVHIDPQGSPLSRTTTPAVTSPARQGYLTTTPSAPVSPSATATNTGNSGDRAVPSMELGGSNRGPVAMVGPDMKVILPVSSVALDGSNSSDDRAIVSYHWDTTSGPPGIKMEGGNAAVATVMGLRVGRYTFRLTVSDQEGATNSASLTIRVQEARSPVAHASGSHTLTLPNNSLVLRGSVTDGDQTEVQYLWVRDNQSPAAGDVLYGSETQPSLYLSNLVEGTYLFQLRVTDAQGRTSTATATVEVRPDPGGSEEVELELLVAVSQVSVSQRDTVLRQLAALLHILDNDIHLRALQGHSHLSTVLQFSVQGPDGPIPGSKLSKILRSQLLREKTDYLLFRVLRVDTVLCLRHCSGHGQCDPITKECVCDPFWTENLIRLFLGDGESNCEWRVLYVILSSFMVMIFVLSASWTLICCCKRRRRTKVRKKTKYTILDNMDEQERVELRPKYSIKHRSTEHNSSLMMSESELDSDQDTIFSRDRPIRSRNRAHAHATRNGNAFG